MKTYLVTGSAGFLGLYIARALADRADTHVVCADNFIRGERDADYAAFIARPNVTHLDIDLTSQAEVARLPLDVDAVYHMAALNGTQNFYERPFDVVKCCTLPTMFLIDHYSRTPTLERFVYAGTSEAYASTVSRFGWAVPTAEDVPLCVDDIFNARWSYGASKMHGEIAVVNGCRHHGLPFTIVRFHNAYGPRMGDKHVIPDFLARARDGRFELFGHADTRSFLYADDAARATIGLAESDAANGQVVNVGGDREIDMATLGRLIMGVCGFEGEIILHPSPTGSVARRAPDLGKLRQLIGFEPEVSLEDGLKRTADYYLA